MLRRALFTAALALLALPAAPAGAATFYVGAAGRDSAAGTSPASAWRTVGKVNAAPLAPGDTVLFEGGTTFADAALMPARSGSSAAPVTFASFGGGKAQLPKGVWLRSVSWITLRDLRIVGPAQGVLASGGGTGVAGLVARGLEIRSVGIGINSANAADSGWTIADSTIADTRDSGVILYGRDLTISGNTIAGTGRDASIPYGKHGVYAKGPGARVVGNTITGFQANGVSIRYPNALVEGNAISGGPIGVAYFQDSAARGTSHVRYNRIRDVDTAGIYLDPSTSESFVLASNTIRVRAGKGIDVRRVAAVTIANNVVTGALSLALRADAPAGAYLEHNNLWHSTAGATSFSWRGAVASLAGYRAASGQGRSDRVADPALSADLVPRRGSPVVDAGTTDVTATRYARTCLASWLSYCGAAPDLGAVEAASFLARVGARRPGSARR
jgi:hypothetical protein